MDSIAAGGYDLELMQKWKMSDNVFKIFNLQKVKKKRFINFTIVKIYLSQTTIETRILLKLGGIMRLSQMKYFMQGSFLVLLAFILRSLHQL